MRPLKWRVLAGALLVSAFVGGGGSYLALRGGAAPARVPWTTLLVGISLGAVALGMAWQVRQVQVGKRKRIDSVRALRTAMLAQASAYAGALLGGMYGAYALVLLRDWSHEPRREAAIAAGLAALGGIVMLIAGVIGEWWCRIKPGDDESAHEPGEPGVAH